MQFAKIGSADQLQNHTSSKIGAGKKSVQPSADQDSAPVEGDAPSATNNGSIAPLEAPEVSLGQEPHHLPLPQNGGPTHDLAVVSLAPGKLPGGPQQHFFLNMGKDKVIMVRWRMNK